MVISSRPNPTDPEPAWSRFLAAELGGVAEYRTVDGSRVDVLTDTHAYEVEWCKKWKESIGQAFEYIANIFDVSLFSRPEGIRALPYCALMLGVEWIQREKPHALEISGLPVALRWTTYYLVIAVIFCLGEFGHHEFIYFQF